MENHNFRMTGLGVMIFNLEPAVLRLNRDTTRPEKHDRVFLVPCKK